MSPVKSHALERCLIFPYHSSSWFAGEVVRNYGDVIPSATKGVQNTSIKQPVGVCGISEFTISTTPDLLAILMIRFSHSHSLECRSKTLSNRKSTMLTSFPDSDLVPKRDGYSQGCRCPCCWKHCRREFFESLLTRRLIELTVNLALLSSKLPLKLLTLSSQWPISVDKLVFPTV